MYAKEISLFVLLSSTCIAIRSIFHTNERACYLLSLCGDGVAMAMKCLHGQLLLYIACGSDNVTKSIATVAWLINLFSIIISVDSKLQTFMHTQGHLY